jgi:hypothetical protein
LISLRRSDPGRATTQAEKRKEATQAQEDASGAENRETIVAKHAELEACIQRQLDYLEGEVGWARALLPAQEEVPSSAVGPVNGRDAALAVAYLKAHPRLKERRRGELEAGEEMRVAGALRAVAAEHKWLSQAALAAKVMAHVSSPTQKKLLNLSYDWLRTFLPHVLAKVNRVSYGLLSSADCAAAIEAAPNVPRSRLKLCVPFVGKDVPSRSSEFAHPDVIIGLTILAYRYSGMRYEDFVDLVDALTAEFVQEIGPARERPASRRHEAWVLAAGGRIRGLARDAGGKGEAAVAGKGADGGEAAAEVVQLKFLQKSNAEQMEKLYRLWRAEPLAIHYYLTKFIFPAYMLSQKVKLSASGQAVGGDMLVGRRVGFSGTPSDLLPKELGRCDYATGDDGKMLTTILDPRVATHELLPDSWSVQTVLERIAGSASPRYHALIDTGALITGYSNQEVAAFLLEKGLEWCDGVVFLDDNDEKQVCMRERRERREGEREQRERERAEREREKERVSEKERDSERETYSEIEAKVRCRCWYERRAANREERDGGGDGGGGIGEGWGETDRRKESAYVGAGAGAGDWAGGAGGPVRGAAGPALRLLRPDPHHGHGHQARGERGGGHHAGQGHGLP